MRAIIDGKRYDTDTATCVAGYWNGLGKSDFRCLEEDLYRTPKGAWFLAGKGGALTAYAKPWGDGTTGGEAIRPLADDEARRWLEARNEVEAIEAHFKIEEA